MILALLRPYAVYIALAGAVLVFGAGWKVRDWKCDAAAAETLKAANKEIALRQKALDDAVQGYETLSAKLDAAAGVRTDTIREIFRNVPSPPAGCLPPPALRGLLASAVSDANAAAASQSGEPVPTASGAP